MTEKQIKARQHYQQNYREAHYKRIGLDVTFEKHEQIKAASAAVGESVNGYIKKAIDARIVEDSQGDGLGIGL